MLSDLGLGSALAVGSSDDIMFPPDPEQLYDAEDADGNPYWITVLCNYTGYANHCRGIPIPVLFFGCFLTVLFGYGLGEVLRMPIRRLQREIDEIDARRKELRLMRAEWRASNTAAPAG